MKKTLMVTAGVAATMIAAPAFAGTGYVGASYVNSQVDFGMGDAEADGWGLDGAVAFKAGSSLGVTLDAGYSDIEDTDATSGVAHLWGEAGKYRFGGFLGLADIADETVFSVGGEVEKHLSNVTLAGALSYANADDIDVDAWGADFQARFFPVSNVRLQGNLGAANVDFGGGADDTAFTIGLGAEWQPTGTPFSLFADYGHTSLDDLDVDGDTFRIGGRFNFGGDLQARDSSGAGLAGLSSLANLVRF